MKKSDVNRCYKAIRELDEENAVNLLRSLQESEDIEGSHADADWVLCGLLKHLGCERTVKAWLKLEKWYG